MPTVLRIPRLPTVILAPLGPNDVDNPDLLTLIVTPGAILIRRKSRKYPIARRMGAMSRKRAGQRLLSPRGPPSRLKARSRLAGRRTPSTTATQGVSPGREAAQPETIDADSPFDAD
jgi:hypothetical protein